MFFICLIPQRRKEFPLSPSHSIHFLQWHPLILNQYNLHLQIHSLLKKLFIMQVCLFFKKIVSLKIMLHFWSDDEDFLPIGKVAQVLFQVQYNAIQITLVFLSYRAKLFLWLHQKGREVEQARREILFLQLKAELIILIHIQVFLLLPIPFEKKNEHHWSSQLRIEE